MKDTDIKHFSKKKNSILYKQKTTNYTIDIYMITPKTTQHTQVHKLDTYR